ncbi:PilZ domain-containing protein [Geomesophilobacter sediminis]|uniref:PilZ domain-containing protein n=1 Tax=Geomesophilobacter sediminis TaxID=2798584 RepID=A0A8J7M0L2_9BACT|nr:PilZ domain-containing protein [Geomesophilobacter sediminis]MBJ6725772.1 PilZ domain-containing protein [Geomesophilobacter sediminis]
MYDEKRACPRVVFHAEARLAGADQFFDGSMEDLSRRGIFVATAQELAVNDVVRITVLNTPILDLEAKVVRCTDRGIGLQFDGALYN